jgi:DNA-binding ferritin-like protein
MASNSGISIQPAEAAEATHRLDELASRVEQLMQREAATLTVTASARDEVSQTVATTLNEVHDRYAVSAARGVEELRDAAATLRDQNAGVVGADENLTV